MYTSVYHIPYVRLTNNFIIIVGTVRGHTSLKLALNLTVLIRNLRELFINQAATAKPKNMYRIRQRKKKPTAAAHVFWK